MHFFWKPYTSDVTQFLAKLKQEKPQIEADQQAGRALLWDRKPDRQAQADWREVRVPSQPYYYQSRRD